MNRSSLLAVFLLAAPTLRAAGLLDAKDRGTFNIGPAEGIVAAVFDDGLKKEVLKFDFKAPPQSVAGVWTKNYPAAISPDAFKAIKASVKTSGAGQAAELLLSLEIKGDKEVQTIPLRLAAGWASVQESVNWGKIGALREVVFVVKPAGGGKTAAGTLYFDIEWLATVAPAAAPSRPPRSDAALDLLDAQERGSFNIGPGDATVEAVRDEVLNKDVLRFVYKIPAGSILGVWTKTYPSELQAAVVDTARIGVRLPNPNQAAQIIANVELKGTRETQTIPVALKTGWSSQQNAINWPLIGTLKEAVLVVQPMKGAAAAGTLDWSLEFAKLGARLPRAPARPAGAFAGAQEWGTFNIGKAEAKVDRAFDAAVQRDVLKFDFDAPPETVVGVWTKKYPAELTPESANTLRIGVKVPRADQLQRLSVSVEVKGAKETQVIPLRLVSGWNNLEEFVNWPLIGALREVVFVVKPSGRRAAGSLSFDLSFVKSKGGPQGAAASRSASAFSVVEARERGTFNIGPSEGAVARTFDEALKHDVLKFDFSAPAQSVVGLWTKSYPPELGPDAAGAVRIGVKAADPALLKQLAVSVEIKGAKDVQSIPVRLQEGWSSLHQPIDWSRIGALREAVLVVSPVKGAKSAEGTLYFDLDFVRSAVLEEGPLFSGGLFQLSDAADRGTFNIGASQGAIETFADPLVKKDVVKFDFSAASGSVVGVWTKGYPAGLRRGAVDNIRTAVFLPGPLPVSVTVEIKGTREVQRLPLRLQPGWNRQQEFVNWGLVGELSEVVFVVQPQGLESVAGTLHLDASFEKLSPLDRALSSAAGRIGLVLVLSGLLAGFSALAGRIRRRKDREPRPKVAAFSGAALDVFNGLAAVLIIGVTVATYSLGKQAETRFEFLFIALAGVVIAEILKRGLTGAHLTVGEVFQNALVTGFLAAASSRLALLQAPAGWGQVLLASHVTSSIVCLIYHTANAWSLASSGRHLRPMAGALMAGTPFAFGWLLILTNMRLVQDLGDLATGGYLGLWPKAMEMLGRWIVVFLFNELMSNAIGYGSRGRVLNTLRAHGWIALISLAVTLSPWVADFGSSVAVAALPYWGKAFASIAAAMISQAGIWAEVYLITGLILDGIRGVPLTTENLAGHAVSGARKGAAYSGIFMAIIFGLGGLLSWDEMQKFMAAAPLAAGAVAVALLFPLIKAVIESFDGSQNFFQRVGYSYTRGTFYLRGAVVGAGLAYGLSMGHFRAPTSERALLGLAIGLAASVGVSLLRDIYYGTRRQGGIQGWKPYFVDACMGGFIGAAIAFYLDASQVPTLVEKFRLYLSAGLNPERTTVYPLLSKWGRIDLGGFTGGVKLFYNETLAGVLAWSVAAWLFAINRACMEAFFQRDKTPIKFLFSRAGFVDLTQHMIFVLRWGLWMAPIINTGLRMMAEATWYNQDGAVRTLVAIYRDLTMGPAEFQAWSLKVFTSLLAFDLVRVLIWMDHMGLRVATLVNLSFIGMNRLDERVARFLAPRSAQRYIPEGVKRFTTWAPLLIPFYIPRGDAWDQAWNESQAIQAANQGGLWAQFAGLPWTEKITAFAGTLVLAAVVSALLRVVKRRHARRQPSVFEIASPDYRVTVRENGEVRSHYAAKGLDVSRRAYDTLDPCGRSLFLIDTGLEPSSASRVWPVAGNFPLDRYAASTVEKADQGLRITNMSNGIRATVDIRLADNGATAEIWTVALDNLTDKPRAMALAPYLEWVLDKPDADRGHTQYSRLFPEMEYVSSANAVLAWQKNNKVMGVLAADVTPEGFLTSRVDFIGRARSLWSPRAAETLAFRPAKNTPPCPSFDPVGALLLRASLPARGAATFRFLVGVAKGRAEAMGLVETLLKPQVAHAGAAADRTPLIGHGEVPPASTQSYYEFTDGGRKLLVPTPYTPRAADHALSNALGHYVMVTNRGLHTTANGNSQQNRITPDWPDLVTRELPGEAIYLYDPDHDEWYSPTLQPLNDHRAKNVSEFGIDGTAVFRMSRGVVSTELTVFVPPSEPVGVYRLVIKNAGAEPLRMRVATYFQIVLAGQPEWAGPLGIKQEKTLNAVYFENPRNSFRTGPAFAATSLPSDRVETNRGAFFGYRRGVQHPFLVEMGKPDSANHSDDRPVAAFLGSLEIPAHGERAISMVLGQTDDRKGAAAIVRKYLDLDNVAAGLEETKRWWLDLMGTLEIKTNQPEFDRLQNWLKYQAVAERLWARRGFYQTSGAFGFRDQLQDSVNLVWVDPALARKQIVLHASQQFIEGDVVHWFHTLHDGRTAFSNRSHASDNLLWLAWAAAEYVRLTGDESLLEERASYLQSETPFLPLPKNKHGWGTIYLRSPREDTVYRHAMKSIDLVLDRRMGAHGLPLIGTGDWNDGLDEIGSEGRGESVWLGLFLVYILKNFLDQIERHDGVKRREYYARRLRELSEAVESTWREDRYLRAFHDDGTEIGVKGSGVWEIDALTAAWAVMADINSERARTVFQTALRVLEKDNVVLLGWPALREDTKPYLGRSSHYPEGVRENGMYCHGDQWLVGAARKLAERAEADGDKVKAAEYRETAYRLWLKISPIPHVVPGEIELYGGQPNKQSADMLTTFDPGRMIWHGYTGAAGWMLRQAMESVLGASLADNALVLPPDLDKPRGKLKVTSIRRDISASPLNRRAEGAAAPKRRRLKTKTAKLKVPALSAEMGEAETNGHSSPGA